MIFRRCFFAVRFMHSGLSYSQENLLTLYFEGPPAKQAGHAFIAKYHRLPYPSVQVSVPLCPLDSLAPLDNWTAVFSRFLHALQSLRPICIHRRRTADELTTTLHFSRHLCSS